MDAKFEINKDEVGEFRFKLVAANGETVAVSDSYKTKDKALKGIKSVKKIASSTVIEDKTA
jgi:uncharacterized protein YegP (UPF0339 family)